MRGAWLIAMGIVPAACGRMRFDPLDDAAAIDPDSAIDAGPSACQLAWRDGIPMLSPPVRLGGISGAGTDRDPWLTPDGLTLYFTRDGAIRESTRPDRTALFLTSAPVAELAGFFVTKLTASEDGLEVFFARDDGGSTQSDIWRASRVTIQQQFTLHGVVAEVSTTDADHDPHLSSDGLRLYFAVSPIATAQEVRMAIRPSRQAAFGTPVVLSELSTTMPNGDPFVTSDERVILFSRALGAGDTAIQWGRRDTASGPFTVVGGVPTVNIAGTQSGDPSLSADSCAMVFSSLRGGTWDLYLTNVVP